MECLYCPVFDQSSKSITLESDELKHLKVLRLKDNEEIYISNGKGLLALARVNYKNNEPIISPIEYYPNYGELNNKILLAICQIQSRDRLEFLIEKAVELGVSEIIIVYCAYSQKINLIPERIIKKAIAALKQSHRSVLPQIKYEQSLLSLLSKLDKRYRPILLDEDGENPLNEIVQQDSIIFTGPEGGFSKEEMQHFEEIPDLLRWNLGNRRLRTETAAIKAISILSVMQ